MFGHINGVPITDISATMLLTHYGRVLDSRSEDPFLDDPKAEEIVSKINDSMFDSETKLLRRLARFKMRKSLAVHAALRAKQYDLYAQEFMNKHPECTVINLGCGLDTRFWRIDNGTIRFFDLDLPKVIELKRGLVQETDRYKMLGKSVFDFEWMDSVLAENNPVILLAEGLFMYLPQSDVQKLILEIGQLVQEGQLVVEMVHEKYTRGFNKRVLAFKFKYELGFGKPMTYQCGIKASNEMEEWSPNLHWIDDWCYFDFETKKLGWMRVLRHIKSFRYTQWTVRYRIGE